MIDIPDPGWKRNPDRAADESAEERYRWNEPGSLRMRKKRGPGCLSGRPAAEGKGQWKLDH